jgi:hypothetical protein
LGQLHFREMYQTALMVDRRAVPLALALLMPPSPTSPVARSGHFWRFHDPSDLMQTARDLNGLHDEYITTLREYTARGIITPRVHDKKGRLVPRRDPDIFNESYPSAEQYYGMMQSF